MYQATRLLSRKATRKGALTCVPWMCAVGPSESAAQPATPATTTLAKSSPYTLRRYWTRSCVSAGVAARPPTTTPPVVATLENVIPPGAA